MSTLGLGKPVFVRKETGSSDQLKVNFTRAYGPQHLEGDDALTYQPSTGTLSATIFNGAITGTATKIDVTNDTSTAASCYPTFVDDTGTEKILKGSKTKLEYVPSSGTLSATTFSGALNGNATSATTAEGILVPSTGAMKGKILYNTTEDSFEIYINSKSNPELIVDNGIVVVGANNSNPTLLLHYVGAPLGTTDLRRVQIENNNGEFKVVFGDDAGTSFGTPPILITRQMGVGVAANLNAGEIQLRATKLKFQTDDGTDDILTITDINPNVNEMSLEEGNLRFKCTVDNANALSAIQSQLISTGAGSPLKLQAEGGNVGIGTMGSSQPPQSLLDLGTSPGSGTASQKLAIYNNNYNTGGGAGFYGFGTGAGTLDFHANAGSTSTPVMTLTSSTLTINGAISKSSGSFNIEHPLLGESHRLIHSFVESSDALNIYTGTAQLVQGEVEINLDLQNRMTNGTFVLLNRDIRVVVSNNDMRNWDQVKATINGNKLLIISNNNQSDAIVTYMITGIRHDAWMCSSRCEETDSNGQVIVERLADPWKPM